MKNIKVILFIAGILSVVSCKKDETLSDAEKVAALKNVSLSYTGMTVNLGLPANALSGLSFDELMAADSATYSDPNNYSISFAVNMNADNTGENAKDAKFDGMLINIVMDTIESNPITTTAPAFDVPENTSIPVSAAGSINLGTHRASGLYIFQQMVDGADLATTLSPIMHYKIGVLQGDINIPDLHQNIPTSVSDETKAFLQGLINSAVFQK